MMTIAPLLLLALLSAEVTQSQEPAQIFVYAQRETSVRSWQPIWCDGTLVARIKRGGFFVINVAPGRHVLQQSKGVPAFVEAGSGDEKFVRLGFQIENGEPRVLVFDKVHPDVANNELRFLSYIDAKQVLSPSVSKIDPRPRPEPHLKVRSEQQ
jgi:hypothetical protein